MKRIDEILNAVNEGKTVYLSQKENIKPTLPEVSHHWVWKIILSLVIFLLLYAGLTYYLTSQYPPKPIETNINFTEIRQENPVTSPHPAPQKILKFSRLINSSDKKIMVDLPHIQLPYEYRINFPEGNATVENVIAVKSSDMLLLKFSKFCTTEKQILIEIYIEM